jgi:hypothetical protein
MTFTCRAVTRVDALQVLLRTTFVVIAHDIRLNDTERWGMLT